MVETPENEDPRPFCKLGVTPETAAAASTAQSIAFLTQNEVDATRNQNTVQMVAMGTAYAKWLQNPVMGDEFKKVVENTKLNTKLPFERVFGSELESPQIKKVPSGIIDHFLSPHSSSED